jgi:hypothetical protein
MLKKVFVALALTSLVLTAPLNTGSGVRVKVGGLKSLRTAESAPVFDKDKK